MDRRTFLAAASATAISTGLPSIPSFAEPDTTKLPPMALGLLISPYGDPEATIKRVHDMGFNNCFLSLDGYINKFTADAAKEIADLLGKYQRGSNHRRSRRTGTARVELPAGAIDNRCRATEDTRCAH